MLLPWNERDKGNAKGEKTRGLAGELHFASNEVKLQKGGTTYAYNRTKHSNPELEMEGIFPKETSTYIVLNILDLLVHIWL